MHLLNYLCLNTHAHIHPCARQLNTQESVKVCMHVFFIMLEVDKCMCSLNLKRHHILNRTIKDIFSFWEHPTLQLANFIKNEKQRLCTKKHTLLFQISLTILELTKPTWMCKTDGSSSHLSHFTLPFSTLAMGPSRRAGMSGYQWSKTGCWN